VPIITQRCIENIRAQVDLADAAGTYVRLKRAGRSWKGLSPFTDEKTPSFYVHPDKGFYKCFSTGKGGDLFNFIMEMEHLEFPEAVEFIARRFNIELEYESGGPDRQTLSLRRQLFDLHDAVTDWFHQQLLHSAEAAEVRSYWTEQRGFTLDAAKRYQIGYAPGDRKGLIQAIDKKRFSDEALAASGLFFDSRNRSNALDWLPRFRGRLMIPIRDLQGRVVAFTARQLEQTPADDPARDAKYVNSPETPLFHKSKLLFGLNHARANLQEPARFVLVEGQLDAIRCWECGVATAVAPQGTALTEEQLSLLRRYDPQVVEILLDGDKAGRAAALRAIPLAFKVGVELSFLPLPDKVDPDGLLREKGAEALEALRANARKPLELLIEHHLPQPTKASAHEKARCMQVVYEHLTLLPSEILREDMLLAAARLARVDTTAAQTDFHQWLRRNQQRTPSRDEEAPTPGGSPSQAQRLTNAQSELLYLLLQFPHFAIKVSQVVDDEWIDITNPEGRLLIRLLADAREGLYAKADDIHALLESPEDSAVCADLQSRDLRIDEPASSLLECITRIHRKHVKAALDRVNQRILNADRESGEDLLLMRDRKKLYNEMNFQIQLDIA
jgi:DNA primase